MSAFNSAILALLTIQRSGSSILLHEAGSSYSTALAVLLGELLKQTICFLISIYQIRTNSHSKLPPLDASASRKVKIFLQELMSAGKTFIDKAVHKNAYQVLVPAALYVGQNNLYLYASGRLQPSTFQAFWQLRLIPTAFLSQILLKKELGKRQWTALIITVVGVIIIQQGKDQSAAVSEKVSQNETNTFYLATLALSVAALLASLAGVLLERLFKDRDTDLWVANYQLSTFSIVPAIIVLAGQCSGSEGFFDPFQTFTLSYWPWITVIVHGSAGILVALTTKYAGTIAGSFSGIASIAFTHLIETLRGSNSSTSEELSFAFGFSMITLGVALYIYLGTRKQLCSSIDCEEARDGLQAPLPPMIGAGVSLLPEKSHPLYSDEDLDDSRGAQTLWNIIKTKNSW